MKDKITYRGRNINQQDIARTKVRKRDVSFGPGEVVRIKWTPSSVCFNSRLMEVNNDKKNDSKQFVTVQQNSDEAPKVWYFQEAWKPGMASAAPQMDSCVF